MHGVFITYSPAQGPSTRFRLLQFLPYLEKEGIGYTRLPQDRRWLRFLLSRATLIAESDFVYIQKVLLPVPILQVIKQLNNSLIFDFDDPIFIRPNIPYDYFTESRIKARLHAVLSKSVVVIAGNRYLEEYAHQFQSKVVRLPTVVDTETYPQKIAYFSKKVRLGWIGSEPNLVYLDQKRKVLKEILDSFPQAELFVVCNKKPHWNDLPMVFHYWNEAQEVADLLSMDIGIMPLTEGKWERGKCGAKLLQYMACGVSAVCSPVGVNAEIVQDGINGFLARTEDEWRSKLSLLIQDAHLRERIGRAGRQRVTESFSLARAAPEWVHLLKTLERYH